MFYEYVGSFMSASTRFYIHVPVDKHWNTYGFLYVIEAGPIDVSESGLDDWEKTFVRKYLKADEFVRDYLKAIAPEDFSIGASRLLKKRSWKECTGPARTLSFREYVELYHSLDPELPLPEGWEKHRATELVTNIPLVDVIEGAVCPESPISGELVSWYPTIKKTNPFASSLIVSNIQDHLGVSLEGKLCIDVGCGSGENAIAMQQAGAKVIGIDPNVTEFVTAKTKGMTDKQLIKATLQEYQSALPDQKFDVATVFLWDILYTEQKSFPEALARIIRPDGYVIISYEQLDVESYSSIPDFGIPKLMRNFFGKVEKFVYRGSNYYILKCSKPYKFIMSELPPRERKEEHKSKTHELVQLWHV